MEIMGGCSTSRYKRTDAMYSTMGFGARYMKSVNVLILGVMLAVLGGCSNGSSRHTSSSAAPLTQQDLALFKAVQYGNVKQVEQLIAKGANVNISRRPWNMTPLLLAVQTDAAIAKILIKAGADVNAADRDGVTALMKTARSANVGVAKLLLTNGAKPNLQDKFGETALVYAIVLGRTEIVDLLIKHGADVNTVRYNGETPLVVAERIVNVAEDVKSPTVMLHADAPADDHHDHISIPKEQLVAQRQHIVAMLERAGAEARQAKVDPKRSAHH